MAVRFLIAFILVSCGASAQVFQTNNVPYKFRGLKADSMLVVPSGFDTTAMANPKWGEGMNGALFFRTKDSTLWGKVGSRWVQIGSGLSIAGGDTTTFDVTDSTGQPARRVLFSKAGNKIGSSGYFLWDTINNKLVINSPLISSGGSTYKLFVNGYAAFDDVLADSANLNYMSAQKVNGLTATDDTSSYKPIAWNSTTKTWASFGRWPVPPTIDTASLSNRINQKVDSITSSNDSLYYYVNGTRYYVSSFTGFDTAVVVKAQVHNAESTTLLAGEVVYGFSSTGNLLSVKRANNKLESTSSKTFGIVRKDIPAGGIGWIVTNGVVDKLNLGAYTAGQEVYLDSINGQFTATKPLAPYNMVFVGIIERANAGNGQLYVKIQNGFELYELHNVSARFPSNNQVLKFRASDSLWHNATDTGITSLTAGVGLTGGTITTIGTIEADTGRSTLQLVTGGTLSKVTDSLLIISGVKRLAAIGSTPNANGATISGDTLQLQPASASFGGVVTTSAQTFAGTKTFTPAANTSSIVSSGYSLTGSNAQPAVDISGTWNTTGTPTLIKANVTNTASNASSLLMDLQLNSISNFSVSRIGDVITRTISLTGSTTSSITALTNSRSFFPTSGTGVFTGYSFSGTINQTGGANGITRAFYSNPTLTAAADWRSIEWSNNAGRGLWGTGTAENAFAGPTTIGAAASPSASAVLDLTSTTRGFLPPRMTAAQRTGIANAAGLLVWDSDSARYLLNNGTSWRGLAYTGEGGGGLSIDSVAIRRNPVTRNIYSINAGAGPNAVNLRNIAIGDSALISASTTNIVNNIAIGFRTLQTTAGSDASRNTVVGNNSAINTQGGANNTVFGFNNYAGSANASFNTAIGASIMNGTVTGSYNVGIGNTGILNGTLSGSHNIALGQNSQNNTTSGSNNISIGRNSLTQQTTSSDGVAIGTSALQYGSNPNTIGIGNNAGSTYSGHSNSVFIGNGTAYSAANKSCNTCTIIGYGSGIGITGNRNTLIGSSNSTNYGNTTVNDNIGIGSTINAMDSSASNQFYMGSNSVRWLISNVSGSERRWTFNGTTTNISATTASAALEVRATAGGFLPPRMTSANVAAITSPATGLSVYDSTDKTNDVYDGTRWNNQPNGLKNSATLDFGSTAAQTSTDLTITVTGAAEGDMVFLGTPNASVNANSNYTAWVSTANTVTVRFSNFSSGAIDPASGTFRVYVIKN